jgi:hypothetical protein
LGGGKPALSYRKLKSLEYKKRLEDANGGCPWGARTIGIVRAMQAQGERAEKVIRGAKHLTGITNDELMALLSAFEAGDFENS